MDTPTSAGREKGSLRLDYWVSPRGDDGGEGTRERPFRTLARGRDAVRAIPRDVPIERDVVVHVLEGTHRLTDTLRLDARDSGWNGRDVVYRGEPGASSIVSGAIPIEGWERDPSLRGRAFGIWRARVPDGAESRQLYVNGSPASRARTKGLCGYPVGFRPSYGSYGQVAPHGGIEFVVSPLNPLWWAWPRRWSNARDIEAVVSTQWKMMRVPFDRVLPDDVPSRLVPGRKVGLITLRERAWRNANLFVSAPAKGPPRRACCAKDRRQSKDDLAPGIWSFWEVSWFENAYAFLDTRGEWYLDRETRWLHYRPRLGEDMRRARVELPVQQVLLECGDERGPLERVRFEHLTLTHATWLGPSGDDGYVCDQSGFHLRGDENGPTTFGHVRHVHRTPGNVRVRAARALQFRENELTQLGGVGLDVEPGCQAIAIVGNRFAEIASAAVQVGGVAEQDAHPADARRATSDVTVSHNVVRRVAREYVDAAGMMFGFVRGARVEHNEISHVPWSGIAMGWGWGLFDPDPANAGRTYPGVPGAHPDEWGAFDAPSIQGDNKIRYNRIRHFLEVLWDGGAIYTTGFQGTSFADGLEIVGNVASHKHAPRGGNVLYTDGGTRFVTVRGNALYANRQGRLDFGARFALLDPLNSPVVARSSQLWLFNWIPYGGDIGGCATYGDIHYEENYWENRWLFDPFVLFSLSPNPSGFPFNPLYYDPCRQGCRDQKHPVRLSFRDNHVLWCRGMLPDRFK